ncbi:hypothetical protein D3C80_1666290 [compost metagenome]
MQRLFELRAAQLAVAGDETGGIVAGGLQQTLFEWPAAHVAGRVSGADTELGGQVEGCGRGGQAKENKAGKQDAHGAVGDRK